MLLYLSAVFMLRQSDGLLLVCFSFICSQLMSCLTLAAAKPTVYVGTLLLPSVSIHSIMTRPSNITGQLIHVVRVLSREVVYFSLNKNFKEIHFSISGEI